MPRNIWSGTLRVSGINMNIKLAPAAREDESGTCYACPEHNDGVEQFYRCRTGGELLRVNKVVRAIPSGNEFIPFTKDELDALESDQNHLLDVFATVSVWRFNPAHLEKPYTVAVDPLNEKAYAAFARALDRSRTIALGRMVILGREKTVAVMPVGKALMVYTLRREASRSVSVEAPATKPNVRVMLAVIEGLTLDKEMPVEKVITDSYRDEMNELIAAKIEDRTNIVLSEMTR